MRKHNMRVSIFDIDGTMADGSSWDDISEDDFQEFIRSMDPIPEVVGLAYRYVRRPDMQVIFLTARDHTLRDVSMAWVNYYTQYVSHSVNPPLFFTKHPDEDDYAKYKARTARRAVRSVSPKPSVVEAYEDSVDVLAAYNAELKPLCRQLRLYQVVDNQEVMKWQL